MAITDGRLLLDNWETNQPVDLSGATGGTADTEIFIEGARSFGYNTTSTRAGLMYDAGTAQDWTNNTFYIWVNCGVVGLLDIKANGGLAVRFAGASASDYFEVNVAGSDVYPSAVSGGWVMLVVDIEKAKTASHRTGGTPPATNNIRYVGISTITGGTMPRMVDNTWMDTIWRLPANTPGITIDGTNLGSDWTFDDIVSASEAGSWGTAKNGPGGAIVINTPIEVGSTAGGVLSSFSDSNKIILWEDWDVPTSFYGLSLVGSATGQTDFKLGIKTGTGEDATGAQGCTIAAEATGQRWFLNTNDPNIDTAYFYGCTFNHGSSFDIDTNKNSFISNQFIDCSSATVSNSEFLKNSIINANTADGVAFLKTDDITDVKYSSFEFSDGHAIELTTPNTASQTSKGNLFSGYGADTTTDAALYNNSGAGLVTISVVSGGDVLTYRNGNFATTTVSANKNLTLTGLQAGSDIVILNAGTETERVNIDANPGTTYSFTYSTLGNVDIGVFKKGFVPFYVRNYALSSVDASLPIAQETDTNYTD